MDNPKWIRNADVVKKALKKLNDKYTALEDIHIYFPQFYEERNLADVGDKVHTLAIVMIAVGNIYSVLVMNGKFTLTPSEINTVNMYDTSYYKLFFPKGSIVVDSTRIVKVDTVPYFIYDTFISKGKVPWFINYTDMCNIFSTADKYAGANVGNRPEIIHLVASLIARDKNDRTIYYRQVKEQTDDRLAFIPIRSIEYGATNTVTKLGGNYFSTGVVSALISPSEKVEPIEAVLRY